MLKRILLAIAGCLEYGLRSLLAHISPDGRIIITISMIIGLSVGSIYMTVSSIYNMGKRSGRQQMEIGHIKRLELEQQQKADSINHKNNFNDE